MKQAAAAGQQTQRLRGQAAQSVKAGTRAKAPERIFPSREIPFIR
jgi:hypothetical protein